MRRSKGSGGLETARTLERGAKTGTRHHYAFRGRVRCGICGRRMEGTPRKQRIYYRCAARTLAPGAPELADHPTNVYLPEDGVTGEINAWLARVFDHEHRADTVAAILEAGQDAGESAREHEAREQLSGAQTRLRRLQQAIEAGADPVALVDPLNRAQREA